MAETIKIPKLPNVTIYGFFIGTSEDKKKHKFMFPEAYNRKKIDTKESLKVLECDKKMIEYFDKYAEYYACENYKYITPIYNKTHFSLSNVKIDFSVGLYYKLVCKCVCFCFGKTEKIIGWKLQLIAAEAITYEYF